MSDDVELVKNEKAVQITFDVERVEWMVVRAIARMSAQLML